MPTNWKTILCSVGVALLLYVAAPAANADASTAPMWEGLEAGPYAVGVETIEKYDYSRTSRPKNDYFGSPIPGERARPIQICIWYPAETTEDALAMVYGEYVFPNPVDVDFFPFVTALQQRELQVLGIVLGGDRGAVLDVMNIEMAAVRDAAHAEGSFPLIVYSPQVTTGYCDNLLMCEYLASHGFVVAATHSFGAAGLNPGENQIDLETLARDREFAAAEVRGLDYVDSGKLGLLGTGIGGLVSEVIQMRHFDVDAVASLSGWEVAADHVEFARACPFVNADRMNVPSMYLHSGVDGMCDLSFVDSWKYSERDFVSVAGLAPNAFDCYSAVQSTTSGGTGAATEDYRNCCRYVYHFFNARLNKSETSLAFVRTSIPGMTVTSKPGEEQPPTQDQFFEIIRARGALEAVAIYDKFNKVDPGSIMIAEAALNMTGYQLLQAGRAEEAVEIFRMNAETYPNSANVWDSYADGCLGVDDQAQAIECYQKVLEVLPNDTLTGPDLRETLTNNATASLERLQNEQ